MKLNIFENTILLPQEVLLLHELEILIKFVPPEASGAALDLIMPKVREYRIPIELVLRLSHLRVAVGRNANLTGGRLQETWNLVA